MISVQAQNIVQTVFADDGDVTMACVDVLAQIEDIVGTIDESAWAAQYPAVYHHVRACGHCGAAYRDIQWVFQQAADRTLVEPPTYPAVDLSFLPNALIRLRQRVGHVTSQGHYWMRNTHGTIWLSLAQYLQARPLWTPMKNPLPNEHLVHLACEPDDELIIELVADAAGGDRVIITAQVQQPTRFYQGYGGTEVALHFGSERRSGITNDAGRIVFAQIPAQALPDLLIQVTPFHCDETASAAGHDPTTTKPAQK